MLNVTEIAFTCYPVADVVLKKYFLENEPRIESWFNVISPARSSLGLLQKELLTLHQKDWKKICGL